MLSAVRVAGVTPALRFALAPSKTRDLVTATISSYVPAATWTVSPAVAWVTA